jgi:pyrophosphatase PpaX
MTTPTRARRLPAILFDMDGTLIDSIGLIVEGLVYAYDGREGPRPTREEWQALIGTPLDLMLSRWCHGPEDVEFLRGRYREFQFGNHDRLVKIYDGVDATLRELHDRGHPMAIVSSKLERGIRKSMDHFKLTPLFDVLVGLESTVKHKPEPEPVLFALEKLGVAPHEAIFVGDSPHDIESGNAAGVECIACTWGAYTRADIEVASPSKWIDTMPALLEHLPRGT